MSEASDGLRALLHAVAGLAIRRAGTVLVLLSIATVLLAAYAVTHLGVDTDNTTSLVDQDLPVMQRAQAFEEHFPALYNSLFVVVDAPTRARARGFARVLAQRLEARDEVAHSVFAAELDPFFEHNALLYLETARLESLSDELVSMQPVIGSLAARPELATIAELAEQLGEADGAAAALGGNVGDLLAGFASSVPSPGDEGETGVAWEDLLLGDGGIQVEPRVTLIVDPVLDFESVLPAGRPIGEIREIAAALDEPEIRVRITGYPALNDAEMRGMVFDVGVAGAFSFLLILGILSVATRSTPVVLASAVTLLVGMVWTAAFTAAAIGRISVV
jgi:predicted RND superfamily exporter protein